MTTNNANVNTDADLNFLRFTYNYKQEDTRQIHNTITLCSSCLCEFVKNINIYSVDFNITSGFCANCGKRI